MPCSAGGARQYALRHRSGKVLTAEKAFGI